MKKWLNNKTITKTIDGEEIEFRRIPVGVFQKLRGLNESASKAISMLFKDTTKDVEIEQLSVPTDKTNPDGTPVMSTEFKQAAIQSSMASMRVQQMEQGVKGLIDTLTSDDTMEVLCEIIATSAYKEFEGVDPKEIKEGMDVATMVQFLIGAFEASAGDYAKLGKSLFQKNQNLQEMVEKVKAQTT